MIGEYIYKIRVLILAKLCCHQEQFLPIESARESQPVSNRTIRPELTMNEIHELYNNQFMGDLGDYIDNLESVELTLAIMMKNLRPSTKKVKDLKKGLMH